MNLSAQIQAPIRLAKITAHTGLEARKLYRLNDGGITVRERHEFLKRWADHMLSLLNVEVEVVGRKQDLFSRPSLFLGNHMSYIDILILFSSAPVIFVAKKQIRKWPIFGYATASSNALFVDRGSKESRNSVGAQIAPKILDDGQSVVIFPSGTTTIKEVKPWRWGAFEIAHEHKIPVRPFRLKYDPLRESAYIDDDMFAVHLWRLLTKGKVKAQIEFHEPVEITDPQKDSERWQNWVREILPK